jgi:hypothetical protein
MNVGKVEQSTNFKGIKVAAAKVNLGSNVVNYDIYKVTDKDSNFLKKTLDNIDISKLNPNLSEEDSILWSRMLQRTLSLSKMFPTDLLLLTRNNQPCSALKYKRTPYFYDVDSRVSWHDCNAEKAPLAGTVLMLQFYKTFLEDSLNRIKMCVVRNSTFDTIQKAMSLGFASNGGDGYNELMSTSKSRVESIFESYSNKIKLEAIKNAEDKPLESVLSIGLDNH